MVEPSDNRPPWHQRGQNRKVAVAALSRAVRVYWDHQKAQPVPHRLATLAAAADEACKSKLAPTEEKLDPPDRD